VAPRVSVLRKFGKAAIYSSIAKGFSSPTTAEAIPTGSVTNLGLNAEQGISYDVGFRGTFFKSLYVDVTAFFFRLKNTIVQRRDSAGGDYYTNAGSTRQRGIEVYLRQPLFSNHSRIRSNLWASYTGHRFRYGTFKQVETDFTGKALPGVAPHTVASGMDFSLAQFTAMLSYYFSSRLPLNDANTAYANAYHLASAAVSYTVPSRIQIRITAGANNLFNQTYSLGNDINAAAGRYYNAAPNRNYYVTLSFQGLRKTAP
jgi:iron complex outermembrane receptor protein